MDSGRALQTDEWGLPTGDSSSTPEAPVLARSGDLFEDTGREVAAILRSAHDSAEEILAQAREEAARNRAAADEDARRIREAAAAEAREDLRRAAEDAAAEVHQHEAESHAVVREAFSELAAGAMSDIREVLQSIGEEQQKLEAALAEASGWLDGSTTPGANDPA